MFYHTVDENGDMTGTCVSSTVAIMDKNMTPILECDLSGVKAYTKCWPMSNSFVIFPESIMKLKMHGAIENPTKMLEDITYADMNENHRIGYKIINNDLNRSKILFMAMVESLYPKELSKQMAKKKTDAETAK